MGLARTIQAALDGIIPSINQGGRKKKRPNQPPLFELQPMERRLFLSSAAFVHGDQSTRGNWTGVYGDDGYAIFNGNTSLPSYAQVTTTNASNWTWPSDGRGLQTSPGASTRIDACDYSTTSFSLNVNLTDGQSHQVAVYMLDWEPAGRSETVTVSDAGTSAVLDTENVSNFGNGQWLVWNISGDVKLTFANTGPLDSVASGVFFGPLLNPGHATFLAADHSTGGTWTGVYGADGYSIFNGNTSLPAYATLSSDDAQSWTWPTDSRGLQVSPGSSTRIDACD